ncbi:hypothetical protein CABS03_15069 [Colletotrichum abscissum]
MRRALGDNLAIFLASLTTPTERLLEKFEVEVWIARNRLYERAQDRGQVTDLRFERAGVFVLTLQAADEAVERSAGREGEASTARTPVPTPAPEIRLMSTFARVGYPINVVRHGESR